MHDCGMTGKLNGSITVTRGPKRARTVEGIMDRNENEALNENEAAGNTTGAPSGSRENTNAND